MDLIKLVMDLVAGLIGKKEEKVEEIQVLSEPKPVESEPIPAVIEPKEDPKPVEETYRRISPDGLALIKKFEGLRLSAYYCPAGVLTVGYGSTGDHVKVGMILTEAEAEVLLKKDLERFEKGVAALVTVHLTDNQFAALVAFAFNVGLNALKNSTLLKKLNAGDYAGASAEFPRWNKAGGVVMLGLTRRRNAEKDLFLGIG